MTRLPRLPTNKLKFSLLLVITVVSCWVVAAILGTVLTGWFLSRGSLSAGFRAASVTHALSQPFDNVLGQVMPDVRVWNRSLALVTQLEFPLTQAQRFVAGNLQTDPQAKLLAEDLRTILPELSTTVDQLAIAFERAPVSAFIVSRWQNTSVVQVRAQVEEFNSLQKDLVPVAVHVLKDEHTAVVLLQNTDELRPTGGFPGSFIELTLRNGLVSEATVQDIYVPDGQFTGWVEAPTGVKEYLSSGRGLRLPDANWSADFPTSAQVMLSYFAAGNTKSVTTLGAVNLSLAEKLLTVVGDVYLPDYQLTVTPGNLAELARADRENFFPGSQQKSRFLQALYTQLKLKLETLPPDRWPELIKLLAVAAETKDVQFFSYDPVIQPALTRLGATGELFFRQTTDATDQISPLLLASVEANVGINKANRGITRAHDLYFDDITRALTWKTSWQNNNDTNSALSDLVIGATESAQPPRHLHYVNYHRLLIPANYSAQTITYQGQAITTWDENIIELKPGLTVKQLGFLLTVLEGQKAELVVELMAPPGGGATPTHWHLAKQSGLPPTPWRLSANGTVQDVLLEGDAIIPMNKSAE